MKKVTCFLLSLILVLTMTPQISFATESAATENVITGFEEMETTDYYYEGDPKEGELTLNLPETLGVYLDGSSEVTDIAVSWEAVEDYSDTDFYFYSMEPVWGDEYTLSTDLSEILDVPWITVYKQEPENDEVEPILTEEEIEPVYTEEEGPVDPEEAGISDITEDAAKSVLNAFTDDVYAASSTNTSAIYKYLTNTMKLNTAAACGVMVNINAESGMSPNNLQNTYNTSLDLTDAEYTSRVDKGKGSYTSGKGTKKHFKSDSAGYGLCQWTSSGRKENLLDRVLSAGKSVGDLNTQMAFLNTELQNSYSQVYTTLKNVPNNAAGAYIAAAEFCLAYEVPANTVATAASRAKTCLSSYWDTYGNGSKSGSYISLCGYSYPTAVKKGSGLSVTGYAVSNYAIKSVTGKITNSSGKTVYSKTFSTNSTAVSQHGQMQPCICQSYSEVSNLMQSSRRVQTSFQKIQSCDNCVRRESCIPTAKPP